MMSCDDCYKDIQANLMGWNYRQSVYRRDISYGPCLNSSHPGMVRSTGDSQNDYAHVADNGPSHNYR